MNPKFSLKNKDSEKFLTKIGCSIRLTAFSANRFNIPEFDTLMGLGNDCHKYICGLCVARTLKALMLYNCVFTLKWWEKFIK